MSESKENKMGVTPIGKLLASMAWPAVLSMTIGALYNIVDSVFVSMISAKALTAVSIIMPVQSLIIAVGGGTGVGVNSLIARRLGAKRQKEADMAASAAVRIAVLNYCIFLIVGLFFTKAFVHYYTNDPTIAGYGLTYMKIICCCSFFFLMQLALEKVYQSTGNMIIPMIMSLSGAVTNLILDPILIFGLFGAPRLGVAGAAIATIIGQAIAMTIAIIFMVRGEHLVTITWFRCKIKLKTIKEIYDVGLPTIVMQALFSFMLLGYNAILASSAAAIAVLGVYAKLQSLVFMPVFGLNQGALPIMGYNYGAKNKTRLMRVYYLSLRTAVTIMAIGTLCFMIWPEKLLAMFNADKDMYDIGIPALRILCMVFIPATFGVVTSTLFQATGHGIYSLIGSILRQCVIVLPCAYLFYNNFGITASWISFPIAEFLGLGYIMLMMRHVYRTDLKGWE